MVSWEEQPLPRSFDSVFYGAAGTPTGASDDEFNRVSFLSHFDGANNGVNNAFDDASASNHTITANNTVTQGSFGPFARPDGEWAAYFDGTGDYLSAEDDTNFSFGTGDFTIECWLFRQDNSVTFNDLVGTANNNVLVGSNRGGWVLAYYHNYSVGNLYAVKFGYQYNNSFPVNIAFTKTLNTNTWYHLAITRQGNQLKCFVDGTQTGSTTTNSTDMISTEPLTVGTGSGGGQSFLKGSISNVRVVKGTAVYTSNFTPPTAPLTAITNTKLLTCQSNRFVDNSASALTVTPAGDASVSAFGPFLTDAVYDPAVNGGSASFGGNASGDGLTVADSSDFELGSGDFTLAMWVYPNNINVNDSNTVAAFMLHSTYSGVGPALGWSMFWQSDSNVTNSFRFMVNGTGRIYDAEGLLGRQWTYLTAVRTGNTLKLFINGVQKVSTSFADFNNSTTSLTIGCSPNWQSDVYKFNGKMSDVFICKGTAVYTSAFTPPTAPLTAITNTKLLLNMADGQAIDSAAQNNLTLFGNAKTSTGQAKFGNTSLLLDGTGDYVALSGSNAFGAGDYTIEMFVYHTSVSGQQTYFSDANGNQAGVYFYKDSNNKLGLYYSGQIITGSGNVPANQWVHISVCRASGTSRLFLDGVLQGSASDTTNLTQTAYSIGDSVGTSSGEFIGYIDDIRVTKGFARYTSNFTAPSEPFADKGQ